MRSRRLQKTSAAISTVSGTANIHIERKMDGTKRKDIQIGSEVEVVQKHHQRTGELTRGFVKKILTKSPEHPHGIKVMLEDGIVGRVKKILEEEG